MAITAADLVVIGAANHAEDDVATQGGVRAQGKKIALVDITANGLMRIVSSSVSDTDQVYRFTGKDATGGDITEDLTANGTTNVDGTLTFERVNKIVRQSGAALVGTITCSRAGVETIGTLEPVGSSKTGAEVQELRKIFVGLVVPGTTDAFVEKVFYHNGHATLTLTLANTRLADATDPTNTDLKQGNAATLNDSASVANRLTAVPVTVVDNQVDDLVVTGNHTAGNSIGVWIENTVTGGVAAARALSFNLRESGQTVG